jgi:rieske iron-sulfur protein
MFKPAEADPTRRADACSGCIRSSRRELLTAASLLGLGAMTCKALTPAFAEPAEERPKQGDLLVALDAESPAPLTPNDVPLDGPQVFAWPLDPAGRVVRKGSRLNKLLLLRLDPATLSGATGDHAADGVVAFSAICPHAGCEVSGWDQAQKVLECSCHYSHFDPREGAAVIGGPATRPLAALPLKLVEGKLAVAKPFAGRVGIVPN